MLASTTGPNRPSSTCCASNVLGSPFVSPQVHGIYINLPNNRQDLVRTSLFHSDYHFQHVPSPQRAARHVPSRASSSANRSEGAVTLRNSSKLSSKASSRRRHRALHETRGERRVDLRKKLAPEFVPLCNDKMVAQGDMSFHICSLHVHVPSTYAFAAGPPLFLKIDESSPGPAAPMVFEDR